MFSWTTELLDLCDTLHERRPTRSIVRNPQISSAEIVRLTIERDDVVGRERCDVESCANLL